MERASGGLLPRFAASLSAYQLETVFTNLFGQAWLHSRLDFSD